MRATKYTLTALAFAMATAIGTSRADDLSRRDAHRDIDHAANSVSKEIRRMKAQDDANHVISVETGVPTSKIHRMHDHWSDAGAGGMMIACSVADYTRQDPENY